MKVIRPYLLNRLCRSITAIKKDYDNYLSDIKIYTAKSELTGRRRDELTNEQYLDFKRHWYACQKKGIIEGHREYMNINCIEKFYDQNRNEIHKLNENQG